VRLGKSLVAGTFIQRDNRFWATVEMRERPVSVNLIQEAGGEGLVKIGILCYNILNNDMEGGERRWRWKVIALNAEPREL